jgi:CHAT domain-containing protein
VVDFRANRGSDFDLPALLLTRGRLSWQSGRPDAAEADWRRGLLTAEQQRRTALSSDHRVALNAARWGLRTALAEFYLDQRHDPAAAWRELELGKAVDLVGSSTSGRIPDDLSLHAVAARVPRGTLMVTYAVIGSRVMGWGIDADGYAHFEVPGGVQALASDVQEFLATVVDPTRLAEARKRSGDLFNRVFGPVLDRVRQSRRLVIVPDGPLGLLPFPGLYDQARGEFLIQGRTVLLSPSVHFALGGGPAPRPSEADALIVANPVRGSADASLSDLPGAETEARRIAAMYTKPVVLMGAEASRDRVMEALPRVSVVHFAGHAIPNVQWPELSRLVLAPKPADTSGALFLQDLRGLRLPNARLVVLAACETARGKVTAGEGVLGLVRGFLETGVPTVVATWWRIDDQASVEIFRSFHEAWSKTGDAAAAMQQAQRGALERSRGESWHWAAPVVVGRSIR